MMKKVISLILALLILLSLFSGCEEKASMPDDELPNTESSGKTEKIPFRILVDGKETLDTSYNYDTTQVFLKQLAYLRYIFSLRHPELDIKVEYIPSSASDRAMFTQKIKTELLVGSGPDIVLLQNTFGPAERKIYDLKPFFEDVNLAMRNGVFCDISEYYDADAELTEGLNEIIMNAGVYDGARYVLPLRYDIPVVYVNKEAFAESGFDPELLNGTIIDHLNATPEPQPGDDTFDAYNYGICQLYRYLFNAFPELVDYNSGKVALKKEDLVKYLEAFEHYKSQIYVNDALISGIDLYDGIDFRRGFGCYFASEKVRPNYTEKSRLYSWAELGLVMNVEPLSYMMENLAFAKRAGIELDMYPLRAIDGSVIANVTFYGAVTAGCRQPDIAYEFLREFLTEEFQHYFDTNDTYLPAPGWPVRSEGFLTDLSAGLGASERMSNLPNFDENKVDFSGFTDADAPILNYDIDICRFSIPDLEYEFAKIYGRSFSQIDRLYPKSHDPEELAEQWLAQIQHFIDEG